MSNKTTGTCRVLVRCPNCDGKDWHVFEVIVNMWPDKTTTYHNSCPSCDFKPWNHEILRFVMLEEKYQRKDQELSDLEGVEL